MKNMDISVIIVSWNANRYLDQCLCSVFNECKGLDVEVIVVDNASTDGSPEMVADKYPSVQLIKQNENTGFAKANNIGMKVSKGKYLFLINSDVIVKENCIRKLFLFLQNNPEVGMVGPRVYYPDGRFQRSSMKFCNLWNSSCVAFGISNLFPKSKIFGGYEMGWIDWENTFEVDVLNGCFWAIRREAYKEVGGLDERFFMYGEDLDWCKRFSAANWKRIYYHQAEAIHYGGGSSANKPLKFYIEMIRANLQCFQKHHGLIQLKIFLLISIIHNYIRAIGYSLVSVFNKNNKMQGKIEKYIAGTKFLLKNLIHK
jgi:GT2 family glycosyltransferase